jgi:hypothetical protein
VCPGSPRVFFKGSYGLIPANARLSASPHSRRLSRRRSSSAIGGSGRTAGRYASAARAFISSTAFEQAAGAGRRPMAGGALGAGGGRVGFAGGGLF